MLQRNLLQTDSPGVPLCGAPESDQKNGGIDDIVNFALAFLKRQYLVIIVTVTLAMAACVVYLRITPPTYTARVQILLAPTAQFVQQQSLLSEPSFDFAQIETQLEIIKSRGIAATVINQLGLENDPDFSGSRPSLFSLWYRIRAKFLPPPEDLPSAAPGQPSNDAITAFLNRLSAGRIGTSHIIEVSYNSSSAKRAAEIANAIANDYIADQLNAKVEANRSATSWLQERLHDVGEQALAADRAVNGYKSQNNIVSSGGKSIDEQQVTDLNSRLVAARAQTSDTLAKLNRYEAVLRTSSENSASIGTLGAGGTDALTSPIINNLRQQYLELARRESEYSARFGHNHLSVINLRTQMQDLRTSIIEEVKRVAESSRSEYEVAKQRQQEIEKQLAEAVSQSRSTSSAELTIRELESRAKELHSLYETFLQRYMGSLQQESFPNSEARVIYPAVPPPSKSKPKTILSLALGLLGGVGLGIGLGLLREVMDRVFRTTAQIEDLLAMPCLSLVPLLRVPNLPEPASSHQADDDLRQRIVSNVSATHQAVVSMPLSRFAEAIRSIKLAVDLNASKSADQVIGVTSALPNEGKTTIAASLAQLIAHSGKKVVIVDCDLRNPSLSACLAPNAATGVVEVTSGKQSLEEAVWRDPKTNLVFLPAFRRDPLYHTSEILSAESMRGLFDRLRATYDYVVVDLPPLTPLVDVRVTSPFIDCFVLVVEWGRSKTDVVQHALRTAPNIYECMIGAVLNKTDIKAMCRYDVYKSDYYSENNYAHYGLSDSS